MVNGSNDLSTETEVYRLDGTAVGEHAVYRPCVGATSITRNVPGLVS